MKYFIGDLGFKTKKECENYTRSLIIQLGCCEIRKDNEKYEFFYNLLENHSKFEEKRGVGIDYFFIIPNPLINKYYQTMIKRIDGSEIDFSWVYCCQFKERTPMSDLIRAMRASIKDETINFKKSQMKLICNYCKSENESYENFHVDHDKPSFKTLKDDYLKITSFPKPTLFANEKDGILTVFREKDVEFENDWVLYHNNNCNLQILCRRCNLTKNK